MTSQGNHGNYWLTFSLFTFWTRPSNFVMMSQGNHGNYCLLSMIFLYPLFRAAKFEVSNTSQSWFMEGHNFFWFFFSTLARHFGSGFHFHKKTGNHVFYFLLAFRLSEQNWKIFFSFFLNYILNAPIYFFTLFTFWTKISTYVMTSQRCHSNHFLLSMIFLYLLFGTTCIPSLKFLTQSNPDLLRGGHNVLPSAVHWKPKRYIKYIIYKNVSFLIK